MRRPNDFLYYIAARSVYNFQLCKLIFYIIYSYTLYHIVSIYKEAAYYNSLKIFFSIKQAIISSVFNIHVIN